VSIQSVKNVHTCTLEAARRENWLPGLVSQSVVLWDLVILEWTRVAKGRLSLRLLATVRPVVTATSH
jgi:hypothetical protein